MNPPQGEDAEPPLNEKEDRQQNQEAAKPEEQNEHNTDLHSQQAKTDDKEQAKVTSTSCKPVAAERPKIELPSHQINT